MRDPKKFPEDYPHRDGCKKKPHLWKTTTHGPKTTGERCSRCGEHRERDATAKEKRAFKAWAKNLLKPNDLHKPFHAWAKRTDDKRDKKGKVTKPGPRGYELIQIAERFAAKHPDRTFITDVDDGHFCGSQLLFITHEIPKGGKGRERHWMGVSVVVIPQCTGEPQMRFFLYPGHLDALLDTLRKIKKRMLTYVEVRRERAREAREAREARTK